MSSIAKLSEKMKKKISFGDYTLPTASPETVKPQETEIKPEARKVYSLSKEDNQRLQEIFSKRLNTSNQTSISQIMSEAIHLLYTQERINPLA